MTKMHSSVSTGGRKRLHAPNLATQPRVDRTPLSEEQRQQMIAEGAYYRAERRGFQPGYERIDWLEAEQDVDAMLNEPYEDAEAPLV